MYFDNNEAREKYNNNEGSFTTEELDRARQDFDKARMLMEAIAQKTSHSQEDFDQLDKLQKEIEQALLIFEIDKEEKLQSLYGSAYEVFRNAKKLAGEGDPGGIEAWKQLKPLYEQMLEFWVQGRGKN